VIIKVYVDGTVIWKNNYAALAAFNSLQMPEEKGLQERRMRFPPFGESDGERVSRIRAEIAAQACPRCGKQPVVPIFYGLMRAEGIESLRADFGRDGYALGGCILRAERWLCRSCGHRFVDPVH